MFKHKKLFKIGAATALTVTGISALTSLRAVNAANFTAIKRVKISYLPGKALPIYTDYNKGRFMGYRAKDGTVWNVAATALDSKGGLWYKVGTREWIEARYTVDVGDHDTKQADKKQSSKIVNLASRVKKVSIKRSKKSKKRPTVNKQIANALKADTSEATKAAQEAKKAEEKAKKAMARAKAKAAKVKRAREIVNQTIAKTKPTSTQASSKASAVVALAKQQIGKPYVWGATGPATFDCSGLVQYVYAHAAGINLPRVTYDQVKVGQTVAMNQLQPGDLLFWGSPTAPYHVAIYIGNNQYINAATPEQGTILQTISAYYYPSIAKRVL